MASIDGRDILRGIKSQQKLGRDGLGSGQDGRSRPTPTFGMSRDRSSRLKKFRGKSGKVEKNWEESGSTQLFPTIPVFLGPKMP